MAEFTLFWHDGKSEIVQGDNAADAMNKAGYGHGALGALDFWAWKDQRAKYAWDKVTREWDEVAS